MITPVATTTSGRGIPSVRATRLVSTDRGELATGLECGSGACPIRKPRRAARGSDNRRSRVCVCDLSSFHWRFLKGLWKLLAGHTFTRTSRNPKGERGHYRMERIDAANPSLTGALNLVPEFSATFDTNLMMQVLTVTAPRVCKMRGAGSV